MEQTTNLPAALQGLTPEILKSLPPVIGTIELGEGHEVVEGMSEITIPRASLMQATSGAVREATDELPVKAGTLINSLTKEILPKKFLPIFKFTNFVCWNPRKKDDPNFNRDFQPGELIFQTTNPKDSRLYQTNDLYPKGFLDFSRDGAAPKVTRYMNFLCYFDGNSLPLVLSFAKTSMKKGGEALNTLARMYGGSMYSHKYTLTIQSKDGAEGAYYTMEVTPGGVADQKELIIGKLWFDMFHGKDIKVDEENPEGEATSGTGWDD